MTTVRLQGGPYDGQTYEVPMIGARVVIGDGYDECAYTPGGLTLTTPRVGPEPVVGDVKHHEDSLWCPWHREDCVGEAEDRDGVVIVTCRDCGLGVYMLARDDREDPAVTNVPRGMSNMRNKTMETYGADQLAAVGDQLAEAGQRLIDGDTPSDWDQLVKALAAWHALRATQR